MEALIFAGGKGTRMGILTKDKPKPLLEVNGKPIMDYIIKKILELNKIDRILLDVPELFLKDFKNRYGDGTNEVKIDYFAKTTQTSGKGLSEALNEIKGNNFILFMGDVIFDMDLDMLINYYNLYEGKYNIVVVSPYKNSKNICKFDGKFIKKVYTKEFNEYVAAGIWVLNKKDLEGNIEDGPFDTVFLKLIKDKKLIVYKFFGYINQANTPKELEKLNEDVKILNL